MKSCGDESECRIQKKFTGRLFRYGFVPASILFFLLSSCAGTHTVSFREKKIPPLDKRGERASQILDQAAIRISGDWDRLLSYQSHLPPSVLGLSRIQKSGTLGRRLTLHYMGPVRRFLTGIGKTIHWKTVVIGRIPAEEPIVEIRAKKEPLYSILRDAGVQSTPTAWIVIRPEGREIDLVYPPPVDAPMGMSKGKENGGR